MEVIVIKIAQSRQNQVREQPSSHPQGQNCVPWVKESGLIEESLSAAGGISRPASALPPVVGATSESAAQGTTFLTTPQLRPAPLPWPHTHSLPRPAETHISGAVSQHPPLPAWLTLQLQPR